MNHDRAKYQSTIETFLVLLAEKEKYDKMKKEISQKSVQVSCWVEDMHIRLCNYMNDTLLLRCLCDTTMYF